MLIAGGCLLFSGPLSWIPPLALLAAAWAAWRARPLWQSLALSGFFLLGALFYIPALEEYRPVRPFARTIGKAAAANDLRNWRAGYFRFTAPSLRFYLDRDIEEMYDSTEAIDLMGSRDPVLLITNRVGYGILSGALPDGRLSIIETRPVLQTTGRQLWKALGTGRSDGLRNELYLVSNRNLDHP